MDNKDTQDVSNTGVDNQAVSSTAEGSEEEQKRLDRVEALKKEEQRLLTSISEKREVKRQQETAAKQQDLTSQGGSSTDNSYATAVKARAFRVFTDAHPEYADPVARARLESMYVSRRGAILWEDIKEDLEDAHYLLNRNSSSSSSGNQQQSVVKKMLEAERADIGGTSSQSSGTSEKKVELSAEERKAFEKLRKVDPSMTEEKYLKGKERRS